MSNTTKSAQAMRSARIAGVQSLYEIEISNSSRDTIMVDFLHQRWSSFNEDMGEPFQPNKTKFVCLLRGVHKEKGYLDEIISAAINKDRKFALLDVLLKSILRAATFELLREHNVPLAVIINEYVEITHIFYFDNEAGFVNGVLDAAGKTLRAQ